jgi:hypothetical protein
VSTPISKSSEPLGTSTFPQQQRLEALEGEASEQPVNPVFAHVMLGCVLGVLFAVAITSPVRPKDEVGQNQNLIHQTASQASTSVAAIAAPEFRDLGAFSTGAEGLTGHLTATWSDKLVYHLEIAPSDPALTDAFAYTIAETRKPLPVNVELQSASGQAACNQQLDIESKSDTGTTNAGDSSSSSAAGQAFQNVPGKDGKIGSISAQGTMPCTRQAFDSVAAWSFAAQFPNLREQAALLQHHAAEQLVAKATAPAVHPVVKTTERRSLTASIQKPALPGPSSVKLPSVPTAQIAQPLPPQLAENGPAPQPFQFQVEGDDEIVDVNASQHSIQTTAGKTFLVREQLAAADGDGVLDELANIHYRCNQSADCTLSLSDATVLHATLRTGRAAASTTELSMSELPAPASTQTPSSAPTLTAAYEAPSSPILGGLEALGR